MFNFDTVDEMNAATDVLAAFAPEVSDNVAARVVAALYGAGFRILRLGDVPTIGAPKGSRGRPNKYDWTGMRLGDSREFPDGSDMRNKLNSSVRQWAKANAPNSRYSITKRDSKINVTRIA